MSLVQVRENILNLMFYEKQMISRRAKELLASQIWLIRGSGYVGYLYFVAVGFSVTCTLSAKDFHFHFGYLSLKVVSQSIPYEFHVWKVRLLVVATLCPRI